MSFGNINTPSINPMARQQSYPPSRPLQQNRQAVKQPVKQSPQVTGWPTQINSRAQAGRQTYPTPVSKPVGNPYAGRALTSQTRPAVRQTTGGRSGPTKTINPATRQPVRQPVTGKGSITTPYRPVKAANTASALTRYRPNAGGSIPGRQVARPVKYKGRPVTAASRYNRFGAGPVVRNRAQPVPGDSIRFPWNNSGPNSTPKTDGPDTPGQTNPTIPSIPHTCSCGGSSEKECSTLSRFAYNSADLHDYHKQQLQIVAAKIIADKINVVVTTGHTDSSGSDKYNDNLGFQRAVNVVIELRNQMELISPGSHQKVFWKIASMGEKQPLPSGDAASNRRVELCISSANI